MTTGPILLVLHQSPLREVSEAEALATLEEGEHAHPRRIFQLDTRSLKDDVEGGHWRSSHTYLREQAARILALANEMGAVEIRYLGIAEVPQLLALGAYLGDERLVRVRDYDRDRNIWAWPTAASTLSLETLNATRETVDSQGDAVLRVEVSYPILDADVEAAIGKDRLANIRIVPAEHPPTPGLVRSEQDVASVRQAVRESLAALASARPNLDSIHLFVAAPVSVCIAVGQELRLRNSRNVQTYRYRSGSGDRALTPALLLTSGDVSEPARALTDDDITLARQLRPIWQTALDEVRQHARAVAPLEGHPWYWGMRRADLLTAAAPFSSLKPMANLISAADHVEATGIAEEFEFDKAKRAWRFSDELILAMFEAAGRDEQRLREHARLFFWHEYVHDWQGLTASTSIDVGRLPNCLERVDYMADAYAICHQMDFLEHQGIDSAISDALIAQIDIALRSFWAFEPEGPLVETQERRLRRYLNWYWQRVRIRESRDPNAALSILAHLPCIEISGLRHRVAGDRIFVVLRDRGGFGRLHIGVVLDDGRLRRFGCSVDLNIEELLTAFSEHDQESIDRFFSSLAEHVK